jgi:hypothetical protein
VLINNKLSNLIESATNIYDLITPYMEDREELTDSIKNVILSSTSIFIRNADELYNHLPEGLSSGSYTRHIAWLKDYHRKGNVYGYYSDLHDLINYDIPTAQNSLADYLERQIDTELFEAIKEPIVAGRYTEIIRNSFIVLSNRLRQTFCINEKIDGKELIGKIFNRDRKERHPEFNEYSQLLFGIYGLLRNDYAHHQIIGDIIDADSTVSMINWLLRQINNLPKE